VLISLGCRSEPMALLGEAELSGLSCNLVVRRPKATSTPSAPPMPRTVVDLTAGVVTPNADSSPVRPCALSGCSGVGSGHSLSLSLAMELHGPHLAQRGIVAGQETRQAQVFG
jgi:hypothetical protein